MSQNSPAKDYASLKDRGNEKFRQKDYTGAIEFYTKAIEVRPEEAVTYSNRAMCHLHLKNYYATIEDCSKAISLDSSSSKAYYRRATASKELSRFQCTLNDLKKLRTLDPDSQVALKEMDAIKNLLKDDSRVEIKICDKPARYRSSKPLKMFELRGQYTGAKLYGE